MLTALPRLRSPALILLTALALALAARAQPVCCAQDKTAAPAQNARPGDLPNFGRVNASLYRGGQPTEAGFRSLRERGIEIVVNLRDDKDIRRDRAIVESLGMRYVSIPWKGFRGPRHEEVAEFLTLLRANPGKGIFVHCRRGAERTGVMVAVYRIAFEGWKPEEALAEMEQFHFRGFWFPHLKHYVRKFPEKLAASSALRAALQPAEP